MLQTDPGARLEQVRRSDQNRVIRYWKRVTEWDLASTYVLCSLIQYVGMSYNFGTVIGDQSQTRVEQRLDRSWTEAGG